MQGGDGTGWIVSPRYREIATIFEEAAEFHVVKKIDAENAVFFMLSDDQEECLGFTADMGRLGLYDDILVRFQI